MSKWSCGILGVGKFLERWKEQNHSKCPRCLTDDETVDHIIHCWYQDVTLCWSTGFEVLKKWILIQHSSPGLALDISEKLLYWRNREELHTIQRLSWNIQIAINSQDLLGWYIFCLGLVSKTITVIQRSFLEN